MAEMSNEDVTPKGEELWKALKKNPLDRQTIRDLLQNGASPNFREPGIAQTKRTPLHFVVCEKNGDEELMQMLLKRGARTNLGDAFCFTPLHLAAERGNLQAVKTLVKHGAEIMMKNKSDETPLAMARKKKHNSVVTFLIQEITGKVSLDVDNNAQVSFSGEQGESFSVQVTGTVKNLMVGDNNRMEHRDNQ
ncbi:ankyrin repeat domain-containing protein 54-like isoform X2 [Montipora foliosa]|uniref:ankyrin repeat domain-containing protein 54-like isoform X2 n=1 Tax=Montipora foliosa TaxID=591990 RepID=UPI0035F1E1CC